MRLTFSHIYSYESKCNLISGNVLNSTHKNNLKFFCEIILWGKVLILSSQYSHKIIEIKEVPLKHLLLLTSIHGKWMKKHCSVNIWAW